MGQQQEQQQQQYKRWYSLAQTLSYSSSLSPSLSSSSSTSPSSYLLRDQLQLYRLSFLAHSLIHLLQDDPSIYSLFQQRVGRWFYLPSSSSPSSTSTSTSTIDSSSPSASVSFLEGGEKEEEKGEAE